MTAGEKAAVISAAKTAIANAIAAQFESRTIAPTVRAYLDGTGSANPAGKVGVTVSLAGDVETALAASIVVNE
jgi:hypothetical protein